MAQIDVSFMFGAVVVLSIVGYVLYVAIQKLRGEGFKENFEDFKYGGYVGVAAVIVFMIMLYCLIKYLRSRG